MNMIHSIVLTIILLFSIDMNTKWIIIYNSSWLNLSPQAMSLVLGLHKSHHCPERYTLFYLLY